jgi:hypothetical protein
VADCCLILKLKLSPISPLVVGSKVITTPGLVLYQFTPANQTHVVNRLRAHGVTLDTVASISLAYCWVLMTPQRHRMLSIHRGQRPLDSHGLVHIYSIRSHSGGPLGTFIPFTPGNSKHSMHSHSGGLLGTIILTICSWDLLALISPASSAGPCWFLLS